MLKKYNLVVRLTVFLSDLALIFICWVLAYALRFWLPFISQDYAAPVFRSHLNLFPCILVIYILVFNWFGLYQPMRMRKNKDLFNVLFHASIVAGALFVSCLYFFMKGYYYSRITLVIFLILNLGVLFGFKLMIIALLRKLRKKGYNLKHVLIVGSGSLAKSVAEKLFMHLEFGYSVVGFLTRNRDEVGKEIINGARIIGVYGDLVNLIKERGLDQVIFCLDSREERLIRPLLNLIDNEKVDLKVILELRGIFTLKNKIEELDGLPILSLRESPLIGWQSLAKRGLDIVSSFLGLIILSPFLGLIALGIKLTSKGPVFYSQERVGMDGKKFTLYKFRSMVDGAELNSGAVFAKRDDPRITVLGKLLRRISLDELPQLFNVLRGDLSLVGPRPERPEFVVEFYKSIPRYMLRHKIRMGMTGWAQVNGLRGDSCIQTRVKYDLYYIEHWSFWFDLKILFLTFFSLFRGEGAY